MTMVRMDCATAIAFDVKFAEGQQSRKGSPRMMFSSKIPLLYVSVAQTNDLEA